MLEAIGDAITPAIAITASPVPVVFTVLVLLSPRGRLNGALFALGWALAATVLVGMVVLLASGADVADDDAAGTGASWLQVLLGVAFFGLAIKTWRSRPRPGEDVPTPAIFTKVGDLGPLGAFVTGIALLALNLKNLPLVISAGLSIARHDDLTDSAAIVAVACFTLLTSASVLLLVGTALVGGERVQAPFQRLRDWLLANNSTILLVLFVILGASMVSKGLAGY